METIEKYTEFSGLELVSYAISNLGDIESDINCPFSMLAFAFFDLFDGAYTVCVNSEPSRDGTFLVGIFIGSINKLDSNKSFLLVDNAYQVIKKDGKLSIIN